MTEADLVLCHGRFRTLDPERPTASAVAIKDGLLLAAGTDSEALTHRGAQTETVDLAGAAAAAGLIDSHFRPFFGALVHRALSSL
jgi:hypothetical protein